MSAPLWEAGHLYQPGDLVQPIQAPAPQSTAITNPGFESGSTDWTLGGGCSVTSAAKFSGASSVQFTGTAGNVRVLHDPEPVAPGTSITASCMYAQGSADAGHNVGRVVLQWLDVSSVLLREDSGTLINSSSSGWAKSTVTGIAPAGAASVSIGALVFRDRSSASYVDQFEWNYATQTLQAGLIYQAVQAAAGFSGTSEPAWPSVLGVTVVDNQVTWEAVATSRVTWTAEPILTSGTVEPDWPTTPGEFVSDGTISWECISRRVEDEKCPNSKVVAIMSGKVFAADGDIVKFSATANPLDWSSTEDAGYLPTGLQQSNANDMAVLAPYRSNLAAFNASSFQNWQVDPDPAAMAILDQMDGIGSTWAKAAQAVGNELFFLSALGVRTVGIAAGAENLSAGDVGAPVDSLVQTAMRTAVATGGQALATYYPSAGQYWLTFKDYPPAALSVSGDVVGSYVSDSGSTNYIATGGVGAKSFSVVSGALPAGALMDSEGHVIWTWTTPGVYSWTVRATDVDGNTADLADTATVMAAPMFAAQASNASVLTSADATAWPGTSVATGLAAATETLVDSYGGKVHVITSAGGAVSSNVGVGWTPCTGLPALAPRSMVYVRANGATPAKWLHIPSSGTSIYKCENGIAFSAVTINGASRSWYASIARDQLVIVGSTNGECRRSTDGGTTFADVTISFSAITEVRLLADSGTMLVAAGSADNIPLMSSPDGVTWTTRTYPGQGAGVQVYALSYAPGVGLGAGRFLAVLNNGATVYSDNDGVTWLAGAIAGTVTPNGGNQDNPMVFANGHFVLASVNGFPAIKTSADGVNAWTTRYTSANTNVFTSLTPYRAGA